MTTPHTAAEILRLARAKIDTPEKWTRCAWARNASGRSVDIDSQSACSFCSRGAVEAVCDDFYARCEALEFLRRAIRRKNITVWNDDRTRRYGQVIHAFDRAIQLADQGRQGE